MSDASGFVVVLRMIGLGGVTAICLLLGYGVAVFAAWLYNYFDEGR